jgi:hypothetical protein
MMLLLQEQADRQRSVSNVLSASGGGEQNTPQDPRTVEDLSGASWSRDSTIVELGGCEEVVDGLLLGTELGSINVRGALLGAEVGRNESDYGKVVF